MPVVNLNKDRVLNLLGKKVSDDVLKDRISYLGTDLDEINDDEIIVEIFPNRPDMLSEEGFARALKSFLGFERGLKKYSVKKSDFEVVVDKSVSSIRPFTACMVVKNVDLDEQKLDNIINIQEKLHVTFGRNRKKCAIGVYPLDNIVFPVHYKAISPKDLSFVPLGESVLMDGFELLKNTKAGREFGHLLDKKSLFPVFVDSNNSVMSVPPILNSKEIGSVNVASKNLFVECSGHDFSVVSKALNMICAALSDMGGEIFEVKLKYGKNKIITPCVDNDSVTVDVDYLNKCLGSSFGVNEFCLLIEKMGFGIKNKNKKEICVLIPFFRADILHPVDIVEDVCISYGFDNIDAVNDGVHSVGKELFIEKLKEKIRDVFVGDGLIEVVNYSLLKFDDQKKISLNNIVKIKNPNTSEFNSMRRFLFPVILKTLKNNKMNEYPQRVFECGVVFEKLSDGVDERSNLCVAMCSDSSNFTWAKQRLDLLGSLFNVEFKLKPKNFNYFISGRSADILLKKDKSWVSVGFVGEVSLDVLRLFELEHAVSLFELDLKVLSQLIESFNL